jgi:hypothetical protein
MGGALQREVQKTIFHLSFDIFHLSLESELDRADVAELLK